MKNLIINSLTILIYFSVILDAKCQISNSNHVYNFESRFLLSYPGVKGPFADIEMYYSRTVNKKYSIGGFVRYRRSLSQRWINSEYFIESYNSIEFSPQLRIYLNKNKIAPFLLFSSQLKYRKYKEELVFSNSFELNILPSLGLNIYLKDKISFESILSYAAFSSEENLAPITLRSGFIVYLNSKILINKIDSLPEKVMKKNNIEIDGLFNVNGFRNKSNDFTYHVGGNIGFFVKDKLKVIGSLNISEVNPTDESLFYLRYGIGAEKYFKINNKLYTGFQTKVYHSFDIEEINNSTFRIPITISLNYFEKRMNYYFKIENDFFVKYLNFDERSYPVSDYRIDLGLNYFLYENIFIKANYNLDYKFSNPGVINMGIGFIFN